MSAQLRVRNITLAFRVEKHLPRAKGNAVHLEPVLMNLITNARDAMRASQERRKIEISALRAGDERILIGVQDDRPGIPVDVAEPCSNPSIQRKPQERYFSRTRNRWD